MLLQMKIGYRYTTELNSTIKKMKFVGESLDGILESIILSEIIRVIFFRQYLPLNLELAILTKLSGLKAWVLMSLPPSALECQACTHNPGFYMSSGVATQVLRLVQQAHYLLGHLPSPLLDVCSMKIG